MYAVVHHVTPWQIVLVPVSVHQLMALRDACLQRHIGKMSQKETSMDESDTRTLSAKSLHKSKAEFYFIDARSKLTETCSKEVRIKITSM